MWGKISSWHLLSHHLWNVGPGNHAGRLEELLILNGPCWRREDVKDSVLPRSYWQAWWNWESTKKEFETMAMWNCIGLPEEFLLRVVVS